MSRRGSGHRSFRRERPWVARSPPGGVPSREGTSPGAGARAPGAYDEDVARGREHGVARRAVPLAAAALLACAGAGGATDRDAVPEAAAATALPEPDPTCRGTVQDRLLVEGVEQVRVAVDVDRSGRLALVQFLTPELTPSQMVELRRALEGCAWRPGVGPEGEPVSASAVLVFGRGER